MTKRTHRLIRTFTTLAVLLGLGGYTYAAASAEMPAPHIELDTAITELITVDDNAVQAAVDGQTLPTAISWAETSPVWTNDASAHSLASISKLITMLVCLEEEPLDIDQSTWPSHVWTADDWRHQQGYIADNGVAFPVAIGTEIPLSDMFRLIFLPSANDMAAAYAYSIFPDDTVFAQAVAEWADRHGFDSLEMVEPTGMDERNRASADDLVRIARIALKHPIITQFTNMPSAYVAGFGTVVNTNPLLGATPNMLGLKTGSSLAAGYNIIVAQESTEDGREVTKIAVTLGRDSLEARAFSGQEMLEHLDGLAQTVVTLSEGDEVGSLTDWSGTVIPLTVDSSAEAVLLPGEQVHRSISLDIPETAPAGHVVGTLSIDAPTSQTDVEVLVSQEIQEPGLWWRLTHPRLVFSNTLQI